MNMSWAATVGGRKNSGEAIVALSIGFHLGSAIKALHVIVAMIIAMPHIKYRTGNRSLAIFAINYLPLYYQWFTVRLNHGSCRSIGFIKRTLNIALGLTLFCDERDINFCKTSYRNIC